MNMKDAARAAYKKTSQVVPPEKNDTSKNTAMSESPEPLIKTVREVPAGKDNVFRRVAKFLIIIGPDAASRVMRLLGDEETKRIAAELATIKSVPDDERASLLEEFSVLYKSVQKDEELPARDLLIKTYGAEKANEILKKARPYIGGSEPFAYLKNLPPKKIEKVLAGESPATIALVLSRLAPPLAANIIKTLSAEDKKAVVLRLAKLENITQEVLIKVDHALFDKTKTISDEDPINGVERLADILKTLDPATGGDIINLLEREDKDLGLAMRERLFTLEDISGIDTRYLSERLHDMQTNDIARLIIKKPNAFREKILSAISQGRRREVLDEEEYGTFLKADCERVTNDFIARIRLDFEKGRVVIEGRNDEDFV